MKKLLTVLAVLVLSSNITHSQARNAGKMVVPVGYENYDSLRFALFDIDIARANNLGGLPDSILNPLLNAYIDSLSNTFATVGNDPQFPIYRAKGIAGQFPTNPFFYNTAAWFKQRMFYALPSQYDSTGRNVFSPYGYLWRYNAANGGIDPNARLYENDYDANDISPYSEFPANDAFVKDTFSGERFSSSTHTDVDSTMYYGNEGRVILGYSDVRNANALLKTYPNVGFPRWIGSTPLPDTAHLFSATLEFAVDTTVPIDTALANGRNKDSLPIVRLQILFKKGQDTTGAGWSVLPFVPFKTLTDTTEPGWWAVVDTTITLAIYRKLDADWRQEDKLASGAASHSWQFKQLHVQLKNMPQSMVNLITPVNFTTGHGFSDMYGNIPGSPITTLTQPDLLVASDTLIGAAAANQTLLETRVLSTYRAKVRVRSLEWEDTIVDKFLYRKKAGDSSYSCNPDGSKGGYDDSMRANLSSMQAVLSAENHLPFEDLINDTGPAEGGNAGDPLGAPMFGYADWLASEYNIHIHWRQQDELGGNAQQFRRARMSLDFQPPSVYEIQTFLTAYRNYPADYVGNAWSVKPGTHWTDPKNFRMGMQFLPASGDTSSDPLAPYHLFTVEHDGIRYLSFLRNSSHYAHAHPKDRRMAEELSAQTWGSDSTTFSWDTVVRIDTIHSTHAIDTLEDSSTEYSRWMQVPISHTTTDTGYYIRRVRMFDTANSTYLVPLSTPEEITSIFYGGMAEGSGAINIAQPFPNSDPTIGGYICMFGNNKRWGDLGRGPYDVFDSRPDYSFVHNYNFGHQYTAWNGGPEGEWTLADTNDAEGDLPQYYIGFSNSWRAHLMAINRINQIYDSTNGRITPHSLRYMTWLDAYSNNRVNHFGRPNDYSDPGSPPFPMYPWDSLTKLSAFLKVVKTLPVDPWHRNPDSSYIDMVMSDTDQDTSSYVEVGLFMDSINTSLKNYAAMVVNTRLWPCRDSAIIAYYNNGLDSLSKRKSLLGDIDVRKIYLKLDLTKTDPTFGGWTYFTVRDLWHPDSVWLLHRDSTFAVYIKPGDAKFLYFEPGIAVNASAQTGTNVGQSTQAEFGFNNGRRVAEIEKGTHSVVTYTKHHKLFVSYPASGETFGASPDESAGDNIITGFEEPIDTLSSHYCARPSICPASNDTGIAIAYWYKDSASQGHVAAAYQKSPGSTWQTAVYSFFFLPFNDTTSDNHWVTPVITPINDTAWLIAAGSHNGISPGSISGLYLFTPKIGSSYFRAFGFTMALDTIIDDTICRALYPTLSSRPIPDSLWPVRFAYQRPTAPEHHEIYFTRFQQLMGSIEQDSISDVSFNLASCDNIHPSLALGGVEQLELILHHGSLYPYVDSQCYDDHLAWEAKIDLPSINTGKNYWPVIHARHEAIYPNHIQGAWGGYSVEQLDTGANYFHYPNVATEPRFWDYTHWYQQGNNNLYDFIRMGFQEKGMVSFLEWAPNWFSTLVPQPYGFGPSLAQSATPMTNWTDSSMVPRSFVMLPNASDTGLQNMMTTNGWLNGINWWTSFLNPNVILLGPQIGISNCTGIIGDVSIQQGKTVPNSPTHQPQTLSFAPLNVTMYGMDDDWPVPARGTNEVHTNNFAINACDSIVIPRAVSGMDFSAIQDALTTSDTLVFRMTLRNSVDSSYLGTVDSMSITKSTVYWAGSIGSTINSETARYQVSCGSPSDSAFVMVEVLRSDITDSLKRAYVEVQDTLGTPPPAPKQADGSPSNPNIDNLVVTVHPNPASGIVKICVEDIPEGIPTVVDVVNEMGAAVAKLFDATPDAESGLCLSLDCSHLSSGIYYADLQTEGMHHAVKFSVEH